MSDPFAGVFSNGRPTAADLLALLDAQGWAVRVKDGQPALSQFRKGGDGEVVKAVAAVLKREPYRSAVLAVAEVPAATRLTQPLPMASSAEIPHWDDPEYGQEATCRKCGSTAWGREVICGRGDCPFRRVTWGEPNATVSSWRGMVGERR